MSNVDETRWFLLHFDVDREEDRRARRLISDVFHTIVYICAAIVVISML